MKHIQRIALYLFFFSINFEVWDPFNTNGIFSLSKFTGYFYLLIMIPLIMKFITRDDLKPILRPIWLFFVLLTLVSILHINFPYYNFFDLSIFQNIILFWILMNHEQFERLVLEKGMLSFALGSVALALLYKAGIGIEFNTDGRITIFGDNQNIIGLRMCISTIIILMAVLQNRLKLGKLRYLLLIPIPIMLQLMAESGSRVSFIAFVSAFIIGILLFKTKNVWRKVAIFTAGVFAFIFVWQFLMQSGILKLRLLESIQEGDLSKREILWQALFPLVKSNPIIGVGNTGYANFAQTTFGIVESPHNVLLELLCLTGITGLFLYLIFLYRIFKKGLSDYKMDGFLLPLILIIPILGMLLSGQILNVKIGWVIFAYIAGRINTDQQ